MFGSKGTKFTSKTVWPDEGKERVDVENPNPGKRAGQIHYQDKQQNKYLYDPNTDSFIDAPKAVNALLQDKEVRTAINKAKRFLGED